MVAFLSALAAFFKAVPYFEKWGVALIDLINKWEREKAEKALANAVSKKQKDNDSSDLEDFINGKK